MVIIYVISVIVGIAVMIPLFIAYLICEILKNKEYKERLKQFERFEK